MRSSQFGRRVAVSRPAGLGRVAGSSSRPRSRSKFAAVVRRREIACSVWLSDARAGRPSDSAAMSLRDLEAMAENLGRRQVELKAQVRAAKRKMASEQPKTCTPWMQAVAVKLFALADFDDAFVQKYLRAKQRSETVADVRAWYESLPPEHTRDLLAPDADRQAQRQLAEAKKFLGEARLVAWVQEQNEKKGVAPTASAVLVQAGPSLARQQWRANRYRWLQKRMHRWGGRRVHFTGGQGQLSSGDFERKVPSAYLALARSPVAHCPASGRTGFGPRPGAFFGARFGAVFGARFGAAFGPASAVRSERHRGGAGLGLRS